MGDVGRDADAILLQVERERLDEFATRSEPPIVVVTRFAAGGYCYWFEAAVEEVAAQHFDDRHSYSRGIDDYRATFLECWMLAVGRGRDG